MESVHGMLCIALARKNSDSGRHRFRAACAVVCRFFISIVAGNVTLFMQIHSTFNLVWIRSCGTGSHLGLARLWRRSAAARDVGGGSEWHRAKLAQTQYTIYIYLTTVSTDLNMVRVQNVKVHKQGQRRLNLSTVFGIRFLV